MNLFFLPALIALALKITILIYALGGRGGRQVSNVFLSLLMVFACHNAIELLGYIKYFQELAVDAHFRVYYVATIAMLMSLNLHAFYIAKRMHKSLMYSILLVSGALALATGFTDHIIQGGVASGYAMSAIKGPLYSVFSLYVLCTLTSTGAVLYRAYKAAPSQADASRALYTLFAFSPLLSVCLLAIALKVLNIGGAAVGILPVGTTLFLIIILKTESKHALTDLRRFLPFSPERKASIEFLRLMDEYAQGVNKTDSFSELRSGLERQAILYTLEKSDNNITRAAEMMGLQNRSTLYSMMKRLGINPNDGSHSVVNPGHD